MSAVMTFLERILNLGVRQDHDEKTVQLIRQVNGLNLFYSFVAISGVLWFIFSEPFCPQAILQMVFCPPYLLGLFFVWKGYLKLARHFVIYTFELHVIFHSFLSIHDLGSGDFAVGILVSIVLFPMVAALVDLSILLHTLIFIVFLLVLTVFSKVSPEGMVWLSTFNADEDFVSGQFGTVLYVGIIIATIVSVILRESRLAQQRIHQADQKLLKMHESLIETAHQAGMSEVASYVLHNIGNAFVSVNTSVTRINTIMDRSRLKNLEMVLELFEKNRDDLARFLAHDPQGKAAVDLCRKICEAHQKERQNVQDESLKLLEAVDQVDLILRAQEQYVQEKPVVEQFDVSALIEDVLYLEASSLEAEKIRVDKGFDEGGKLTVRGQRYKLMSVLINLLRNATYAMRNVPKEARKLLIVVSQSEGEVKLSIQDSGEGIPDEIMEEIFHFGFSTWEGHYGFGLHLSANQVIELGGKLIVESPGIGQGATFSLILPLASF